MPKFWELAHSLGRDRILQTSQCCSFVHILMRFTAQSRSYTVMLDHYMNLKSFIWNQSLNDFFFICPACWPSTSSSWMKTRKARAVIFPGFSELHSISECGIPIWWLGLWKTVLQNLAGCRRKCRLWTGHGGGVGWMEWRETSYNSHVFFTLFLVGCW